MPAEATEAMDTATEMLATRVSGTDCKGPGKGSGFMGTARVLASLREAWLRSQERQRLRETRSRLQRTKARATGHHCGN